MEEEILDIIKKENGQITFRNILDKNNIGKRELENLLLDLKLAGKILQVGNKYRLFPEDLLIGSIIVSSTGKKYIMHNDDKIVLSPAFF